MNPLSSTCPCGCGTISRRRFLNTAGAGVLALHVRGFAQTPAAPAAVPPLPGFPIIDIHVHCTHRGRPDEDVLVHQRNTGARTTILLPAGETGGLAAGAAGNDHVAAFVRRHPDRYVRFANENAFRPDARRVVERHLKAGAIGIGELKDKVACDSAEMIRLAELAREYEVPMSRPGSAEFIRTAALALGAPQGHAQPARVAPPPYPVIASPNSSAQGEKPGPSGMRKHRCG